MGKAGEENSGEPFALLEKDDGRILICRQTDPETQQLEMLFAISNEMVQTAADYLAAKRVASHKQ